MSNVLMSNVTLDKSVLIMMQHNVNVKKSVPKNPFTVILLQGYSETHFVTTALQLSQDCRSHVLLPWKRQTGDFRAHVEHLAGQSADMQQRSIGDSAEWGGSGKWQLLQNMAWRNPN